MQSRVHLRDVLCQHQTCSNALSTLGSMKRCTSIVLTGAYPDHREPGLAPDTRKPFEHTQRKTNNCKATQTLACCTRLASEAARPGSKPVPQRTAGGLLHPTARQGTPSANSNQAMPSRLMCPAVCSSRQTLESTDHTGEDSDVVQSTGAAAVSETFKASTAASMSATTVPA